MDGFSTNALDLFMYYKCACAHACPTFPLSTLRAADSSDCDIMPFSAPKVFTTDDTDDGIDNPCEFSARTKNIYDVAGFNSPIYVNRTKVKMKIQI